jgi:hypothetical protein
MLLSSPLAQGYHGFFEVVYVVQVEHDLRVWVSKSPGTKVRRLSSLDDRNERRIVRQFLHNPV